MFERSEEDIAAGVIRLHLGGQEVQLPTLPWAASEEWQASLQATLVSLSGRDLEDLESAIGILSSAMGALVDLVAEYDRGHKLGRDSADLRGRYDRAQLYEVFKAIARHEYPFMRDAEGVATMLMPVLRPILISFLGAVASRQGRPSSGPSPTGDSTPAPSEPALINGSSGSSGVPVSAA